jgi:hypothetical protein
MLRSHMERALAVVEPMETAKELVVEAGVIAESLNTTLYRTHDTTEREYSGRREAIESLMSSSANYTTDDAKEGQDNLQTIGK